MCHVSQKGIKCTLLLKMDLNSWSSCLNLSSPGVTGVFHQDSLVIELYHLLPILYIRGTWVSQTTSVLLLLKTEQNRLYLCNHQVSISKHQCLFIKAIKGYGHQEFSHLRIMTLEYYVRDSNNISSIIKTKHVVYAP